MRRKKAIQPVDVALAALLTRGKDHLCLVELGGVCMGNSRCVLLYQGESSGL